MLVASMITFAACSHKKEVACPPLDELARRDANADATAAAGRGDTRLVMLEGYVGELPGGLHQGQVRVLAGTSVTPACEKKRPIAFRYARIYNRTILKSEAEPGSLLDPSQNQD